MLSFTIKKAERTETEARRNIIGHVGGSSAVYDVLSKRVYFYLQQKVFIKRKKYNFSYIINHYMKRNNFLVDHIQHFSICFVEAV
jgi:hypothetical protein